MRILSKCADLTKRFYIVPYTCEKAIYYEDDFTVDPRKATINTSINWNEDSGSYLLLGLVLAIVLFAIPVSMKQRFLSQEEAWIITSEFPS